MSVHEEGLQFYYYFEQCHLVLPEYGEIISCALWYHTKLNIKGAGLSSVRWLCWFKSTAQYEDLIASPWNVFGRFLQRPYKLNVSEKVRRLLVNKLMRCIHLILGTFPCHCTVIFHLLIPINFNKHRPQGAVNYRQGKQNQYTVIQQ